MFFHRIIVHNHIFPSAIMLLEMYKIYFNQGNSIIINSKIYFNRGISIFIRKKFPLNNIYFNRVNSIFRNSKTFFHWIKYISSLQTLTKGDEFDKSLITTRTTTTKSILRPLPQYLLAVKQIVSLTKYSNVDVSRL